MSKTDDSVDSFRHGIGPEARGTSGLLRRMGIGHSVGIFWQVYGHLLADGRTLETREAEAYSGVGFYARPPDGTNAEVIVAFIAGAENPMIIAARDEDTRRKVAQATALGANADETYVFNSQVVLQFSNTGLIRAFLIGGPVPVPLALKSDVDGAITAHNGHTHTPGTFSNGSGAVVGLSGGPNTVAPASVGSSVLRG